MENSKNIVWVTTMKVLEDSTLDKTVVAGSLGKALGIVTDWMKDRHEWFNEGDTLGLESFIENNWTYASRNYVVKIDIIEVI